MFLRIIAVLFASVALVHAQTPSNKAWSILRDGAADKSSEKRAKAMNALGLLTHNTKARQMAENGLLDKELEVRAAAASALGQQGSAISIPKLKEAVKDAQTEVVFCRDKRIVSSQGSRCLPGLLRRPDGRKEEWRRVGVVTNEDAEGPEGTV